MTHSNLEYMTDQLRSVLPEEGCGILFGRGERVEIVQPVDNVLHSPTAYRMDARQQVERILEMEARGLEMVGIYHSHPSGPPEPSDSDVAHAYYPDALQVIVSFSRPGRAVVSVYTIDEHGVGPASLLIE